MEVKDIRNEWAQMDDGLRQFTFEKTVQGLYDETKSMSLRYLDLFGVPGFVNNNETQSSDLFPVVAALLASSALLHNSFEDQAQREDAVVNADTKFAADIADGIAILSDHLVEIAREISAMHSQYQAILSFRRNGILITDLDGSYTPAPHKDLIEQLNASLVETEDFTDEPKQAE